MKKILLQIIVTIPVILVSSCTPTSKYSHKVVQSNMPTKMPTTQQTYQVYQQNQNIDKPKIIPTSNYVNISENMALSQLVNYLNNSVDLIHNANAHQRDDARYKFNYGALNNDMLDIIASIKRYIQHDKTSQIPRKFQPLTKRY